MRAISMSRGFSAMLVAGWAWLSLLGVAQAGVVHQWNLDDGSGGTVTSQIGGVDGTINGSPSWQSGGPPPTTVPPVVSPENHLSFSSTLGDYVDFGTSTSMAPANMTVAFWFKYDTAPTTFQTILSRNTGGALSWEFNINAGSVPFGGESFLEFKVTGGANTRTLGAVFPAEDRFNGSEMADGNWHFVAATYDVAGFFDPDPMFGGTFPEASLYVDGELIHARHDFVVGATVAAPAGSTLRLGQRNETGFESPFGGRAGGPLLIFDEALSQTQIQTLMTGAAPIPEPSSVVLASLALTGLFVLVRRKRGCRFAR